MLCVDNTTIYQEIQGFSFVKETEDTITGISALCYTSNKETEETYCPYCGARAYIKDYYTATLKDMPYRYGIKHTLNLTHHRYKCSCCSHTFTEQLSVQCPGTRITLRNANWIKGLLKNNMSVNAVVNITGVHWHTVRKLHKEYMDKYLSQKEEERKRSGYKPKYLAVDEFAIHKGHTYATCVMDLETGEVIWAGRGRAVEEFRRFFEDTDMDYLSNVQAVAMDMNAAYNRLVEQYLPQAAIVYDRYHMQAEFGKEVLGSVRLREAEEHKEHALQLKDIVKQTTEPALKASLKAETKAEMSAYSKVKKARRLILRNSENITSQGDDTLQEILKAHEDLSVCYAMKEEMCRLFDLRNKKEAKAGWEAWFEAAKVSGIAELEDFARRKEKRLAGLAAHAEHPISTGRLEGFNNRIKVAKRLAFGYRNDDYFFTLIKFISVSKHGFPEIS